VRAAFEAGVTPSRIARQFGLSKRMFERLWPLLNSNDEREQTIEVKHDIRKFHRSGHHSLILGDTVWMEAPKSLVSAL
jgi:hypothetical protein